MDPANVAPLVVWLGSEQSQGITERVFSAWGGRISVLEGWAAGPSVDRLGVWDPNELGDVVRELVAKAAPNADGMGVRAG
jgi:hypothetical protein